VITAAGIIVPEYDVRYLPEIRRWGWIYPDFRYFGEIPTTRERIERCRDMRLLLCTCHGVDVDNRHVVIHDPWCQVHQIFEKVRRVYFC
jgi:hypothetical protein